MLKGKYTDNEDKLLRILRKKRGKFITTLEIVEQRYTEETRPVWARHSVVTVLNTLMKKVKKQGEDFTIEKSARKGPYPSAWRIENVV